MRFSGVAVALVLLAGCSGAPAPLSSADTAALVQAVTRFSTDTLHMGLGPKASHPQACDTVMHVPMCHFTDVDGVLDVRTVRMRGESATVHATTFTNIVMESFGAVDAATNARVKGKKMIITGAKDLFLVRDAAGRWRVVSAKELDPLDSP